LCAVCKKSGERRALYFPKIDANLRASYAALWRLAEHHGGVAPHVNDLRARRHHPVRAVKEKTEVPKKEFRR
jgi:hypothetical protein